MNPTDEEILAAFQVSGDATTLNELSGRHLERVRNLAYRLVLCDAAADDIAHRRRPGARQSRAAAKAATPAFEAAWKARKISAVEAKQLYKIEPAAAERMTIPR